ncbi:MAG: YkgJ family cysteine cluster protein [Caldilineaceae bacterium]|nr:YkgJ family cysteine cluster protein [Caldilineaceae bacterium]
MNTDAASNPITQNGKTDPSIPQRRPIAQGLLYTHNRLNANLRKTREAAAYIYALIELLHDKGIIGVEELESRREVLEMQLLARYKEEGQGVALQDPEQDKYTFADGAEIDCANRIHRCKASCCRLPFALSRQDIHEGIVHWDLGQPYLIEHGQDGYCTHMAHGTCACTIYDNRPVPCRGFDCRNDQRIWLDFDQMIPNPAIEQADWPYCLLESSTEEGEA